MIFYSQTYEDILIYRILKQRNDVFYIDVGANDPVKYSVTKFFYDNGGHGINIEPSKEYYEKLVRERKRDINLNLAVGSKNHSKINANIRSNGWLFNGDYSYFDSDEKGEKAEIETTTLTTILDKYLPDNQSIHVMKIDIDGFEKECLLGMDFNKYRPWCICIEVSVSDEWEEILLSNQYIRVWRDELNAYYVDLDRLNNDDVMLVPRNCETIGHLYELFDAYKYNETKNENKRLESYPDKSDVLSRMLKLKSQGNSFLEEVHEHNYASVAVYGMSLIGERIVDECIQQGIPIGFAIDQKKGMDRYDWDEDHIDVYTLETAPLDGIECIIVALVNDECVVKKLSDISAKKHIDIFRIKELIK